MSEGDTNANFSILTQIKELLLETVCNAIEIPKVCHTHRRLNSHLCRKQTGFAKGILRREKCTFYRTCKKFANDSYDDKISK